MPRVPAVQQAPSASQRQPTRQSTRSAPQASDELTQQQIGSHADASAQTTSLRQLQAIANNSPQAAQLNSYRSMQQASAVTTQMKAMQEVMHQPALQRVASGSIQSQSAGGVAQLDELDSVEDYVNPRYVENSKIDAEKDRYIGTPSGKFSSESSEDKRRAVATKKLEEEASGEKLLHQPVADLGELYAHIAMLKPEYDHQVQAIASATGGLTKFRGGVGMKSLGRTLEKINGAYRHDASRIVDLTGASIYYDSVNELVSGYNAVEKNDFFKIVRVKNTLAKASSYGDINLALEMGRNEHRPGFVIELQLHLTPILVQKDNGGHKLYEDLRDIEKNHPNTARENWKAGVDGVTQKEIDTCDRLDKKMKAFYGIGWNKLVSSSDRKNRLITDKMQPLRDQLATIKAF